MNRIYVYPWDQLSKSAGAIAVGLETQKLLRKGSRYRSQGGDVIVNWGASDCPFPNALNANVNGALDKVAFFDRLDGTGLTPAYCVSRDVAEGSLKFPILCRTKTKGCDGAGIVIAETKIDMVDARLYVELEAKTAEYRVHIGRDPNGGTSIIGVQQKFLPRGDGKKRDVRLRTTGNGCYFVWSVGGELVDNIVPPTVLAVTSAAFKLFPELTFVGADVIYDEATGKATVIEFNSAPEMTPQAVERYAKFFNQFRQPPIPERVLAVVDEDAAVKQINFDAIDVAYSQWFDPLEGQVPLTLDLVRQAFRAGWQGSLDREMDAMVADRPLEREQFVNYMYGIRDGIDVV